MRIVVVGGGIGGLVLAQGLRRRGVEVRVLERDTDLALTGGYRLHLDPGACAVLRRELPAERWDELESVSAGGGSFTAMHVTDRRLRLLVRVPAEEGEHRLVGRRPLRLALAGGLDDVLDLGVRVTGWRAAAGGEVGKGVGGGVVVVTDRGDLDGDLLVAADGVGSVVARQAAGRATSAPIGLVGLAGRVDGLAPHDEGAPAFLTHGPALAIGPRGTGMFVTRHDVATPLEEPGWVWGLVLARPVDQDPRTVLPDALRQMAGWSPWARGMVASTPADRLGHYRFHAADPHGEMLGWTPGPVAVLGDAVHAMPPTGGQSASTAIADAGDLLAALDDVRAGRRTLEAALSRYQVLLEARARPRVRESLGPARWVQRTSGPVGSAGVVAAAALVRGMRLLTRRGDAA
ncbi:FAD-dependent oxidoreductase [Nocardioides litoris]|uniref:FAD-dependent oxidoreductase n=1 Tax=Nocardioides litoris TaxID=1926648 RepID=UPI0014777FF0|nr:FAD-dependent monooxygenase [Nocardioides litoris]